MEHTLSIPLSGGKLLTENKLKQYIGGEMIAPSSGEWVDNINPATGEVFCRIPKGNAHDVDLAVLAAGQAKDDWAMMPASIRSELLMDISKSITEHLEELALVETTDNGKPLWLSRTVDIPRAASNFHFFATGIEHFASESHAAKSAWVNYTLRQPLGIVGCISPWNLPLYLFTWKIAPALAAGNCVIAKPSEITPVSAYLLAKICRDCGMPPGVLNIVHGTGPDVGAPIVAHADVKAISFTGGTKTGAEIARTAAPMFKKMSLELGGKNPNIIFADCDYEHMLDVTMRSSFANQGQICLCGSRILVERPIYERFKKDFTERTSKMVVGDPLNSDSKQGALVSKQHLDKVMSFVDLARREGGNILTGGEIVQLNGRCHGGWFMRPTVIEGLSQSCRCNKEEIFGPVVTIQPFDTQKEALEMANATEYGLAATLWTNDLKRAHCMAENLQAGIVWINCWLLRDLRTPFGGAKNSGMGREGGWEAIRFFTEPKNVCIKL